jgi:uncharacterized protein YhfF
MTKPYRSKRTPSYFKTGALLVPAGANYSHHNRKSDFIPMDWRKLETFSFGDSPDLANMLLELVLLGKKTATCWAESQGLLSAEVGKMMVVLDGQGVPKAVSKTTELTRRRFNEVDAAFAYDEGEGDRSLQYWPEAHNRYFTRCSGAGGSRWSNAFDEQRAGLVHAARKRPHVANSDPAHPMLVSGCLLPQDVIAFAGHDLDRFEIDDLDDPSGIADSASRLYPGGDLGDQRAPTPSISARNSCVSGMVSLSARSRVCSSHRQNRASI